MREGVEQRVAIPIFPCKRERNNQSAPPLQSADTVNA